MSFSQIERTVIWLAAHPREREPTAGWFAHLRQRWFGQPQLTPLANPRLEGLRRLAAALQDPKGRLSVEPLMQGFINSGWQQEDSNRLIEHLQLCGGAA